jgi:hypothetical protein
MKVAGRNQATIFSRFYQNEVFIDRVDFLEVADAFQGDKIHPMLMFPKYPLGFNGNFHRLSPSCFV